MILVAISSIERVVLSKIHLMAVLNSFQHPGGRTDRGAVQFQSNSNLSVKVSIQSDKLID